MALSFRSVKRFTHSRRAMRRLLIYLICVALILTVIGVTVILRAELRSANQTRVSVAPDGTIKRSSVSTERPARFISDELLRVPDAMERWGYEGSLENLLALRAAVEDRGPHMDHDHDGTLMEATVSLPEGPLSRATTRTEVELRQAYQRHKAVRVQTGCDMITVPFVPAHDAACIEYMSNRDMWEEIIPIGQSFDRRTIKFEVKYKPFHTSDGLEVPSIRALMKVPQKLFPPEAFSEVAAYHTDRVLELNRVPPAGWTCVRVKDLSETVEKYSARVRTDELFLRQSKVSNYSEWIEKDLFQFARENLLIEADEVTGEPCIGASLQLYVADVTSLLASSLAFPYTSHVDSWQGFFNLSAAARGELSASPPPTTPAGSRPSKKRPPPIDPVLASPYRGRVPYFYNQTHGPGLMLHAELTVYDYVIGNMDRSPNKNNFVTGGYRISRNAQPPASADGTNWKSIILHPNHPTGVRLDQGSAFYILLPPRRNSITESLQLFGKYGKNSFCLFRAPLIRRLLELEKPAQGSGWTDDIGESWTQQLKDQKNVKQRHIEFVTDPTMQEPTLFAQLMQERLPHRIQRFFTREHLKGCMLRIQHILDLVQRCINDELIRDYVFFP